jgi:WhiB family redox-sensing transcriptional regulator
LRGPGARQSEDPELFSPVTAYGAALHQVNAAKAVCRACAVRAACLSVGLQTSQDGIWGGTTPKSGVPYAARKAPARHGGHLPIPQVTV